MENLEDMVENTIKEVNLILTKDKPNQDNLVYLDRLIHILAITLGHISTNNENS